MRASILSVSAFVALALTASVASAQSPRAGSGRPGAPEHRAELRDKLKSMTPEERKAALAAAKERRDDGKRNASDAQKAHHAAMQAELKATHEAVKAGTLTRQSAAAQLKAWREAHPAPKKG
ncbi:MAG: hypothetical protein V4617_02065 [Gemmatimonadota bacterium]